MEYGERLSDSHGIAWRKPTSLIDQKKCTGWIDWRKKEIYLTDTKNREDASCELTEEIVLMLRKLQNFLNKSNGESHTFTLFTDCKWSMEKDYQIVMA